MKANLLFGPTSIQSFPSLTTGHDFLHSWLHFFGLHFSDFTMAIRVLWSASSAPLDLSTFFLGGMLQPIQYSFLSFHFLTTAWSKPGVETRRVSLIVDVGDGETVGHVDV
jgi:hypothetical protein